MFRLLFQWPVLPKRAEGGTVPCCPPMPGKPELLHVLAVQELRAQPATRKGYGGKEREEGEGLHACYNFRFLLL